MPFVRVTRAAKSDLDKIWLYIARDNVNAATVVVDALTTRFYALGRTPLMGRVRNELLLGLRSHAFENYVIFYRVSDTIVSIQRVIHAARDLQLVFRNRS